MFARFLLTDMIRAQAKASGAFAISLILLVAALPALAQQPAAPTASYGYGGPWGWHLPFAIISLLCVLLALIGLAAIFVWLVRWATCRAIRFMAKACIISIAVAAATAPHSTFSMSALLRARSTRPSSKRNASYSAGKAGACPS